MRDVRQAPREEPKICAFLYHPHTEFRQSCARITKTLPAAAAPANGG